MRKKFKTNLRKRTLSILKPDRLYSSLTVSKLINKVMIDGKKNKSLNIVYSALLRASKITSMSPLETLEKALENIYPRFEVKSKKRGNSKMQSFSELSAERSLSIALRWIVISSRDRKGIKGKPDTFLMKTKLGDEIIDAINKTGSSFKKKEDLYKMAKSSSSFIGN
jgi:small subunit ribosomal protein S7